MPAITVKNSDVHRVLRIGFKGADVSAVQDAANRRLHARGLDKYVCAVDGVFGLETLVACEKAGWAIGLQNRTLAKANDGHVLTVGAQRTIREPDEYRTAKNLTIAKARAHELAMHTHAKAVSGVHIDGNHVTGGTPAERVVAAAVHAKWLWETGQVHRYYSMVGGWDVDHAITGPAPGHRDDCSSWFIGLFKAAGLPDPAGTNYQYGNTETLWNHGHEISVQELVPGLCGVIYGKTAASSHHIEWFWKGSATIGHGDSAVNQGSIYEMRDAHFFRFAA